MEHQHVPEIDPVVEAKARLLIERFEFGEYADTVIHYGDQRLTMVQGLVRHWDQTVQLPLEEIYTKIAGYAAIAKQQAEQQ